MHLVTYCISVDIFPVFPFIISKILLKCKYGFCLLHCLDAPRALCYAVRIAPGFEVIALFAHRSHRQVEMTAGPLLPNVLAFAVPLILSGMLQLLYNSADIIVVGRFADSVAMASVGATTSLIHLLVSLLMGLSVGASVAVARAAGAGDRDGVHRAVHTSMALAVLSGAALGVLLLRPLPPRCSK